MSFQFDFTQKLKPTDENASSSLLRNVGYFFLQKLYHDLKLKEFFQALQDESKATYCFNDVNRFLAFGRILDPGSKLGLFDHLETYYAAPCFEYQHILRFMDVLVQNYDGYYAVATDLDDPAKDVLEINSQRYKIEDCFRVLKTNFRARPVYHRKEDRITAHFLVCYTALLIYRLLENKLDAYGTHFTTDEILGTLKNMNVLNIEDALFTATYAGSNVCTSLNAIFDLGLDKKYYLPKDLNKKLKKIN